MAQRYWNKYISGETGKWTEVLPPGEDLAALRSGLGREALTVPKMWQFYSVTAEPDGDLERFGAANTRQQAEHAALTLFGVHQQSQRVLMHQRDAGLGTALRALRRHDKSSGDAVDRRVEALVTSTSVAMMTYRLRGLVIQLRDIGQPLDYDRLVNQVERWHWPAGRQSVRKGWAQGYQRWGDPTEPAGN
ncbi:type I-E CRISPR-associated protein Cse2/CasB [Nocardia sp. CA-145437]|uniref:type I-E CRISPR-associated protein Cse2/CasB n=1 Tax=Nocardia sp. CA-145437 TaxID=3239980 RepID=UPI003D992A04